MVEQAQGLWCQSCGMPLEKPEDFGTAAGGLRSDDYCRYCLEDGIFTEQNIDVNGMIARCAGLMVDRGVMPEEQAGRLMAGVIPKLKRWRKT